MACESEPIGLFASHALVSIIISRINNFSKKRRFDVENKSQKFSKFLDFWLQFRLIFELEIKS